MSDDDPRDMNQMMIKKKTKPSQYTKSLNKCMVKN